MSSKTPERLPRGQVLTSKWPVLTYGDTPAVDRASWTFRCFGAVGKEVAWTWTEFLALPRGDHLRYSLRDPLEPVR